MGTANNPNTNSGEPYFQAIASAERGWWVALTYDQPGMVVPFDAVNGAAAEGVRETPVYALETTTGEDSKLYLIASGCLVDVDTLGQQLKASHATGKGPDSLTLRDLLRANSVTPLTEDSPFRLPPQKIGSPLKLQARGRMATVKDRATVRSIEADMRPYNIQSASDVVRFAARVGIAATGVNKEGFLQGDLGGTPLTDVGKRLKYALIPAEVQGSWRPPRHPLNKGEVIDSIRGFLADKLQAASA
jgi:hypothetical protein